MLISKCNITILFFVFCYSTVYALNRYDQVFKVHSACLALQEEPWPQKHISEYLSCCMQYQLHPQEYTKKRLAFKVLAKTDTSELSSVINDVNTWNDLHLFAGNLNAPTMYLARCIDRTILTLGRAQLFAMLVQPTTAVAELEQRKKVVQHLMQDTAHTTYTTFLNSMAADEPILLSFFGQDPFYQSSVRAYFDLPYFKNFNAALNQSPMLLLARDLFSHHKRVFDFAISFAGACILPLYALSIAVEMQAPAWLQPIAERLQGIAGKALSLLTLMPSTYVQAGTTLTAGAVCALSCKEDYTWAKANLDLDYFLHKKMVAIARILKTMASLVEHIRHDAQLLNDLPEIAYLVEFFNAPSSGMVKLLNLLNTSTFESDDAYLVHQGRVLVAFRLMHQLAEQPAFIKALYSIAALDAHLSIATLLRTSPTNGAHFSFAQYAQQADGPFIQLTNFWHPEIDPAVAVCNSVTLDGHNNGYNMLITGPNAAGKSTIMSAIIINLILAQTLCIFAAQGGVITPYSYLGTYINIVDDIAAGNSLFKAQVKRSFYLLNRLETLPETDYGFVAFDEPFVGTSDKEAAACIYGLCDTLNEKKNIMCAVSTHCPHAEELVHEYPSFGLYRVGVATDKNGILMYPFKLEQGISRQYVALDLLEQEGFSPQFLSKARSRLPLITKDIL